MELVLDTKDFLYAVFKTHRMLFPYFGKESTLFDYYLNLWDKSYSLISD